jgi:spore coat polysaccharide biosynthesis predicted glycosyltransferase SpsG
VRRKNEVVFVCSNLNDSHENLLNDLGCALIRIGICKNEIEDVAVFLAKTSSFRPEIVVVDSYKLKIDWESRAREVVTTLVVIADIPDVAHSCDYLIDQNLTQRTVETWSVFAPRARVLIGPRYALLNSTINQKRILKNHEKAKENTILVYFGGTDVVGVLTKTVNALESIATKSKPAYVVAYKEQWEEVLSSISKPVDWCIYREPNDSFVDLMAEASLGVGAGGITVWERMCLGIDQVLVSIAANQEYGCKELRKRNLATYLGGHQSVSDDDIRFAVQRCITEGSSMNSRVIEGQILVDGLGSARVVESIIPTSMQGLSIRLATESDVVSYFAWVNDPAVRSVSLNKDEIERDTHLAWFEEKFRSEKSKLYVFQAGSLPVGQVRFDFVDDHFELDYSLDIVARERGWSKVMLKLALDEFRKFSKASVFATVETQNALSISALTGVGYRRISEKGPLAVFMHD